MAIKDLLDFQIKYLEKIVKSVEAPKWKPELTAFNKWAAKTLAEKKGRKPFDRQLELVIAPQAFSLIQENRKAAIIAAEMGTGKTQMSLDLLYLFHKSRNGKRTKAAFVASGAKHIQKMIREAEEVLGKDSIDEMLVVKTKPKKRPVKFLRNDGSECKYREVTIEEAVKRKPQDGKILYVVISKDTGKLAPKQELFADRVSKCPSCGHKISKGKGRQRRNRKLPKWCRNCKEPLFYLKEAKTSAAPIAWKLKRLTKSKTDKLFDFAIVDEVHEMQSLDSQQSAIYHAIVRTSAKVVIMTGTLVNGFASSLFYILYPLIPYHFHEYGGFTIEKIGSFIDIFGSKEAISFKDEGGGKKELKINELPKISDRIVGFLAPYTTWMSVADLQKKMPPLKETIRIAQSLPQGFYSDLDIFEKRVLDLVESAVSLLGHLKTQDVEEVIRILKEKERFYFNVIPHFLLNNPFASLKRNVVIPKRYSATGKDEIVGTVEFEYWGNREDLLPKERLLVEDVKRELKEGRRILLYGNYINVNSLFERLEKVLRKNVQGITVDVVPQSLPAEKIEAYIKASTADVLMVSQERVATGLDLVMFQTVMFYELNRKVRTVEQAKMRPWRPIGQEHEVRVYYYAYQGSQEKELIRMAQKMRASSAVNGKIVDKHSIARQFDYDIKMTEAMEAIKDKIENQKELADSLEMLSKSHSPFIEYFHTLLEADSRPLAAETEKEKEIEIKIVQKSAPTAPAPKKKPQRKVEGTAKIVEVELKKDQRGQLYMAF